MSTFSQFLNLLSLFKVIKTDRATFLFGISAFEPKLFGDLANLDRFEPLADFAIILFEFEKLFVRHFIGIWKTSHTGVLLAFLNSSLEEPGFFFLGAPIDHAIHQHLHHYLFFSFASLLLLQMNGKHLSLNLMVLSSSFVPFVVIFVLSYFK
jgi:hypothetical protein